MEEAIKLFMLACTFFFVLLVLWDISSLLETFIQYIDSLTAQNEERAKLYAVIRKKQELMCKKTILNLDDDKEEPDKFVNL